MPVPSDLQSIPDGEELEGFLSQRIWPVPTKFSNTTDLNPWENLIESYVGRDIENPPMEGRPPGLGWSHQRWDEFKPKTYFQTAQTGARTNGGVPEIIINGKYRIGRMRAGGMEEMLVVADYLINKETAMLAKEVSLNK